MNKIALTLILLIPFIISCNAQNSKPNKQAGLGENKNIVGGAFENRELTYYGIPKFISATDTSPGWKQKGQKILLTGIVYQQDGKTPAPNVLLYYYQTNAEGKYLHKPEEKRSMPPNALGQTHGYIRGWVKTDTAGKYFIYTSRPGTYPTNDEPAHVHVTVKEPNDMIEYYLDDFVFDDDKLLTTSNRLKMKYRGGSGVLRLVQKGDLQIGERNLVLGLNIPDYPGVPQGKLNSGRNVGEDVFSFIPYHAWGPDRGTKTCPVCKYGWYHGILYFVGNHPNWNEIKQWLVFLENEGKQREKYLKVYFVYGNENDYDKKLREKELEEIGNELKLEKTALTFVPSFSDSGSDINFNKINQGVENTFILYKRSRIIDKFINLKPVNSNFELIARHLDKSINEYFDMPPLHH